MTPKQTLADAIAYYVREPLSTVLLGLGITLSVSAFLGGLVLAAAGTALAFRRRESAGRTRRGERFWGAIFSGVLVSVGIAMIWPSLPFPFSAVPVQFGMLLGGFMSAEILEATHKAAKKKLDDAADKAGEE